MKIKFKFGNREVKLSYEGILDYYKNNDMLLKTMSEVYKNNNNPFGSMFSNPDLDGLKEMYEKIPSNIINYYKEVNEAFDKYFNKTNDESTQDNLDVLPATGHDIYNYVARYGLANFQIQAIMRLDGHLDFDKLSRAVRLSVDAQPVFGCRFVEKEPPYWKPLNDIDKIMFCSLEKADNLDEAIQRFLESPLDMDKDPMVKLKLIRSEQYDTLCVKVNHACCDGTGVKEYIQLLSDIYSAIDQENDVFISETSKRSRKDQDRLFSELGIADPEAEWIDGSEITRATWPFPWKQLQSNTTYIAICRLSQEQLNDMTRYSKTKGATINDLILTAYYRAMSEMGQPIYCETMEIPVTIDLRRFLPNHKTEAIRNFSGSEFTRMALVPNESFDETLSRIVPMMNEIKNDRPGLQSAIGLERVERMTLSETFAYYKGISQWHCYCGDKCAPVLSNLGMISNHLLKFDENIVADAYIVPPVVRSPGLLLMVSTYNGIVTLTAGIYKATIQRKEIDRLLNRIKDELVEGCRL